ncbi:CDP-alcohol phosphatidyltransferase family protein [Agrococcus sp. Marseille-Q4369]|uniref:CDP-alcohol phosphatidyltransferase family protein n=1 Tax=Agrococcus sp. Marseille-Q4369 TaxID=2810513 RepID=UPI001B8AEBAA|nr:CDP-alcohol phosphatidyltransferase family protein [Agrococcus sp. Marseille-Q4369]QUW18937.1 CDP-alcohol phosphatidyltransferase family protein [Agrococcus sp. Marseille-Q4369]
MTGMSETMARLGAAQKSSRGAPAYSRFINRPLGRPLAAVAAALGLSPTQVTLVSAVSTFTGIACIALLPLGWAQSALITALLVLGYALDSADGQLARLTGRFSLSGEWLDHFFDAAKAVSIHLAVLVAWLRYPDLDPVLLIVPLGFAVVASTFFFGIVAVDLLRRIHRLQHPDAAVPERRDGHSPLYSLLVSPNDYGVLCLIFLLLAVPAWFVPLYAAIAAVNAVLLVAASLRWHRSLRALEPAL